MSLNEPSPIFIIGSPRSGTSLLRLILTNHSKLIIPPECGFNLWLHNMYGQWTEHDSQSDESRMKYLASLQACKKFDTWALESNRINQTIISNLPTNYAQLSACVYMAYAEKIGKSPSTWGDKNNYYISHIPELATLYPTAKFLHIVRDGRDIACSYREVTKQASQSPYSPNLPTEIEAIASQWASNVNQAANALDSLPPAQRKTIRYEDLVRDPVPVITGICNWLGLVFEARMLEFHEENKKAGLEPSQTLDWKKRTLEPISDHTVGRYLHQLTSNELSTFQNYAREALTRFSYT